MSTSVYPLYADTFLPLQKDGEDSVLIQNMDTLSVISKLLRVQEETLRLALTTRKSRAGGADFFVTPYKMEEAVAARDSLAKALYGSLFDWIVDQVNISLASSSARTHPHKVWACQSMRCEN